MPSRRPPLPPIFLLTSKYPTHRLPGPAGIFLLLHPLVASEGRVGANKAWIGGRRSARRRSAGGRRRRTSRSRRRRTSRSRRRPRGTTTAASGRRRGGRRGCSSCRGRSAAAGSASAAPRAGSSGTSSSAPSSTAAPRPSASPGTASSRRRPHAARSSRASTPGSPTPTTRSTPSGGPLSRAGPARPGRRRDVAGSLPSRGVHQCAAAAPSVVPQPRDADVARGKGAGIRMDRQCVETKKWYWCVSCWPEDNHQARALFCFLFLFHVVPLHVYLR